MNQRVLTEENTKFEKICEAFSFDENSRKEFSELLNTVKQYKDRDSLINVKQNENPNDFFYQIEESSGFIILIKNFVNSKVNSSEFLNKKLKIQKALFLLLKEVDLTNDNSNHITDEIKYKFDCFFSDKIGKFFDNVKELLKMTIVNDQVKNLIFKFIAHFENYKKLFLYFDLNFYNLFVKHECTNLLFETTLLLFFYFNSKYIYNEDLKTKNTFILSIIIQMCELFKYDENFFNDKINCLKNIGSNSSNFDKEIKFNDAIFRELMNFNSVSLEDIQEKIKFIRIKLETDSNLYIFRSLLLDENKSKKNLIINCGNFQDQLNKFSNKKDIFNSTFENLNKFLFCLYEENLKSNLSVDFFDERIFISKYFVYSNLNFNLKIIQLLTFEELNKNNSFENILNELNTLPNDEIKQKENLISKSQIEINDEINFNKYINKTSKIGLDFVNSTNSSVNNSKRRSYKTLNFNDESNNENSLKSMNITPLSKSVYNIANDWLDNLIKSDEKKFNFELHNDVLYYLDLDDKVIFKNKFQIHNNKIKTCIEDFLLSRSFDNIMTEIELLSYKLIKELIARDEKKYPKKKKIITKILTNENFLKSVLLASTECVLFHHNSADALFNKIASEKYLNLDLYEFWKILNPLVNLVAIMDNNVSRHLYEVEIILLTFLIWHDSKNFKDNFNYFIDSTEIEEEEFENTNQKNDIQNIKNLNKKEFLKRCEFNNQSLLLYLSEKELEEIDKDESIQMDMEVPDYSLKKENKKPIEQDEEMLGLSKKEEFSFALKNNLGLLDEQMKNNANFDLLSAKNWKKQDGVAINKKVIPEMNDFIIDLKLYKSINKLNIILLRIRSYAEKIIEKLCKALKIKEEPEKESRMLFNHFLKDKKINKILFEKHIDQIIIFCILSISKKLELNIDLQNLIKNYKSLIKMDEDLYVKNIFQLPPGRNSLINIDYNEINNNLNKFYESIECYVEILINKTKEENNQLNFKKRKLSVPDDFVFKSNLNNRNLEANKNLNYTPVDKIFNNENSSMNEMFKKMMDKSNSVHVSPYLSKSIGNMRNQNARYKRMKEYYNEFVRKFDRSDTTRKNFLSGIKSSGKNLKDQIKEKFKNNPGKILEGGLFNFGNLSNDEKKINKNLENDILGSLGNDLKNEFNFGNINSEKPQKIPEIMSNFDFKNISNFGNFNKNSKELTSVNQKEERTPVFKQISNDNFFTGQLNQNQINNVNSTNLFWNLQSNSKEKQNKNTQNENENKEFFLNKNNSFNFNSENNQNIYNQSPQKKKE